MKIMIEDNADPYPNTYNLSQPFTVRGDINLTSPVGGEKWGVGSQKWITWQRNGGINTVRIAYSISGDVGPWAPIQDPTDLDYVFSNSGSFLWTVLDDMTPEARVRVENADVSSSDTRYVKTESGADFKIMARFDLTAPNGGETALVGQNFNSPNGITWNKWGADATNVKIDLATGVNALQPCSAVSAASFNKEITPTTSNDGSHPWLVDSNWVTPAACLRIYDVNDVDSEDRSASPFIIRASLGFVEPTTTTPALEVGQPFLIIWSKQGNIANVKLEYSPGNNDFTTDIRPIEPTADGIVPNINAAGCDITEGCYSWTVPDIEDTKDENIKLRIRDPNDSGAEAISEVFKIVSKLTVLSPNGNADSAQTDQFKVATSYPLTWSSSSTQARTPNVNLYYSTNGGGSYNIITTTVNDGSYPWITANGGVPDLIGTEVRIRVEDATEAALCTSSLGTRACDQSNNNFKIISDFTLTAPDGGGAPLEVGDPLTVTWSYKGTLATNEVELAYSTAGSDFSNPVVFQTTIHVFRPL